MPSYNWEHELQRQSLINVPRQERTRRGEKRERKDMPGTYFRRLTLYLLPPYIINQPLVLYRGNANVCVFIRFDEYLTTYLVPGSIFGRVL